MLELNHVGYTTEDGMEILKDITLKIDERFVAITGPNGGGMSTLAKVIAVYISQQRVLFFLMELI